MINVGMEELFEIIQHINLIRAKFASEDVWRVYSVLYSGHDSVDIIMALTDTSRKAGERVDVKFQRNGYEYIVDGEIVEVASKKLVTATIKFTKAKKYYNLRKHIRFEVELYSEVMHKSETFSANVLNISKGGAMFTSDADFLCEDFVMVSITFMQEKSFKSKAKVMRKQGLGSGTYNYGIQFVDTSKDDVQSLNAQIAKLEKAYFNSLKKQADQEPIFETKFVVFSTDKDESYAIREELVKLGAENFDVINNFGFYFGYVDQEKPKFAIFDLSVLDEEVRKVISNIKKGFPQLAILLILPIEYKEQEEIKHITDTASVLFKPLIYSEIEDIIIRYM